MTTRYMETRSLTRMNRTKKLGIKAKAVGSDFWFPFFNYCFTYSFWASQVDNRFPLKWVISFLVKCIGKCCTMWFTTQINYLEFFLEGLLKRNLFYWNLYLNISQITNIFWSVWETFDLDNFHNASQAFPLVHQFCRSAFDCRILKKEEMN